MHVHLERKSGQSKHISVMKGFGMLKPLPIQRRSVQRPQIVDADLVSLHVERAVPPGNLRMVDRLIAQSVPADDTGKMVDGNCVDGVFVLQLEGHQPLQNKFLHETQTPH
jgi:hypothetical protein